MSVQAEADTRLSSTSDVINVEVVSRESVPPGQDRVSVCLWGGGNYKVKVNP